MIDRSLQEHARIAYKTAMQAGSLLLGKWRMNAALPETAKNTSGTDFVTEMDGLSQDLIQGCLVDEDPTIKFLGEENAPESLDAFRKKDVWVCDPLDGTTFYGRGNPDFGVSIALVREGHPVAGSIVMPARREYAATSLSGPPPGPLVIPPTVSNVSVPQKAIIGMSWGYTIESKKMMHRWQGDLIPGDFRTFQTGSSVSLFMDLVQGRMDGVVAWGKPWDVAVGGLLVQMAGGIITHHDGSPWTLWRGDYVAANKHLHPLLLDLLNRP